MRDFSPWIADLPSDKKMGLVVEVKERRLYAFGVGPALGKVRLCGNRGADI